MKTDLHIHTTYSDGTESPDRCASLAAAAKVDVIAKTDHNTLAGSEEFVRACIKRGLRCMIGTELTTSYSEEGKEREIHLLAYFHRDADVEGAPFSAVRTIVEDFKYVKTRQNESIVRAMEAARVPGVSLEDFRRFAREEWPGGNLNRVHIGEYLIHLGLVQSLDQAFDEYVGESCRFYVPRVTTGLFETVRAVHMAGGAAVVAHAGEYGFNRSELDRFFEACINNGIDGFELLHPHNDESMVNYLRGTVGAENEKRARAGKTLLVLTEGSDFHGKNKTTKIGEPWSTALPECIINRYPELSQNTAEWFERNGFL